MSVEPSKLFYLSTFGLFCEFWKRRTFWQSGFTKSFLGEHRSRHRQVRLLDPEGDLSAEAKDLAGDPGERHQDLLAARLWQVLNYIKPTSHWKEIRSSFNPILLDTRRLSLGAETERWAWYGCSCTTEDKIRRRKARHPSWRYLNPRLVKRVISRNGSEG